MSETALSPAVQHWLAVVLAWIGFGTLAGLTASVLFPVRRPAGTFWSVVLGIAGSSVGLLGLGWLCPGQEINPIHPLGFLAAVLGAFVLLVLYRIGAALFGRPKDDPDGG
jgi:uncharacterized membrane protein YeaQ/YmgE (transglycosylase-associated protein family)